MAEEEEVIDLANRPDGHYSTNLEKLLEENDAVFLSIIVVGLLAHFVIIYTTVKSKRLSSRTNTIIMNWIIFEMFAHNIVYPILHYARLHEHSYLLHLLSGNVLVMTIISSMLCLNVLLTDSVMMSNKASFKEFLERFYAIQMTVFAIVLFWKLYTQHDVYMEFFLVFVYIVSWLVLAVRLVYRQCHRIIKWPKWNKNEELRVHLVTFFLISKLIMVAFAVSSAAYKSKILMHLSKLWCLSGIYVIALLIIKDISFKISLFEIFGLNVKSPNDVDTMITDDADKDGDENFLETCIEN